MTSKKINGLNIYQFENLSKYGKIFHFITTRNNGASPAPFESLNLGYKSGDDIGNVSHNWDILKKSIGLINSKIFLANQIHSDRIIVVSDSSEKFIKYSNLIDSGDGDALITDQVGIVLAVLVADCVPVVLYDPIKSVIAVIHAGWRSSMLEITKKTVKKMKSMYNSKPKNIIAGIGPSIGPCCYEVKKGTAEYFNRYENAVINREDRYYIDLWDVNKTQLLESGLDETNIEVASLCTSCNAMLFFSYRRQNPTGRFAVGVMIK